MDIRVRALRSTPRSRMNTWRILESAPIILSFLLAVSPLPPPPPYWLKGLLPHFLVAVSVLPSSGSSLLFIVSPLPCWLGGALFCKLAGLPFCFLVGPSPLSFLGCPSNQIGAGGRPQPTSGPSTLSNQRSENKKKKVKKKRKLKGKTTRKKRKQEKKKKKTKNKKSYYQRSQILRAIIAREPKRFFAQHVCFTGVVVVHVAAAVVKHDGVRKKKNTTAKGFATGAGVNSSPSGTPREWISLMFGMGSTVADGY